MQTDETLLNTVARLETEEEQHNNEVPVADSPETVVDEAEEELPEEATEKEPLLALPLKDVHGDATTVEVIIKAEEKDRTIEGQLGTSAGAAPITPSVTVEVKLTEDSLDFDEMRDFVDAAGAERFLTDHFAENITQGTLYFLKPGEKLATASTPGKVVPIDLPLKVKDELGVTAGRLALALKMPAGDLVNLRQRALRINVRTFREEAGGLGMPISESFLAKLIPMDKATFFTNLKHDASMDCKQLIKIEQFIGRHTANKFSTLQAAIDDASPAPATGAAVEALKRNRTAPFTAAAKVLFAGSLDGWRAAANSGQRNTMAKQILAKARPDPPVASVIEAYGSTEWTEMTVKNAMKNLMSRKNKASKVAEAAAAAAPRV